MRLTLAIILSASITLAFADLAEDVSKLPPIKIDKNLRRALLKALEDLEAESAEQKHEHPTAEELVMKITTDAQPFKGTTFSFDGFPPRDDVPSEDKLQNSTFVETEKIQVAEPHQEEKLIFHKHDVLLGDKSILEKSPDPSQVDQILPRSVKTTGSKSNSIDQPLNKKEEKESLSLSPSNGIVSASANSLIAPSPTPPSPTVKPAVKNITSPLLPTVPSVQTSEKPGDSEVKIFQAPLVAAFTVQQDERGIPKSVVPLYKPGSDNQGLTLQEQLDFKQQLLERQLNELQAQHAQQTEFLLKQQQLYQEQLRNKQRQQLYLQEQSRLKQIEEQRQLQLQQQQQQLQQQQQQQKQQQQLHQQQQQQLQQQQPQALQGAFTQNNFLAFQPPFQTQNVQFQSSQSFQLPNTALPPPFQQTPSVQDQQRLQQLQRQQFIQQQAQQLQLQRQQALYLQQQRLQQSFPGFQSEFQPPSPSSANRFHRQEAFGTVGNLGLNENRQNTRNHLTLEPPRIPAQNFGGFNQFAYRQQAQLQGRTQTPARQIQHLLFQSGVAGGLNNPQGNTNQEDLNIVSKVLALNVGAVPNKTVRYNQESFSRA